VLARLDGTIKNCLQAQDRMNRTEDKRLDEALGILSTDSSHDKPKLTLTGKFILAGVGASFVTVTALTVPFILPAVRRICLPYVPATTLQVNNVMTLLGSRVSPGARVIDLGSGDGRIVIEAAKRGYHADGVELNPWLVWYSRYRALREGVSGRTTFHRRNLFSHDMSKYGSVVIFGVDTLMPPLRVKLLRELGDTSCVIACRFPFTECSASQEQGEGLDTVWMYTKKDLTEVVNNVVRTH